jgi:hypothetical protein
MDAEQIIEDLIAKAAAFGKKVDPNLEDQSDEAWELKLSIIHAKRFLQQGD